jgi:RiboL-PSP-HEPN
MTPMRGASEANRLRNRLKAVFDRAKSLRDADAEILSDYARNLCVLVSGFVETAVAELAIEHCRNRANPSVVRYTSVQLGRIQNMNSTKLLQLINSFDKHMFDNLSAFIEGPRKEALDSVLNLRNTIAHGESVSLSMGRITDYFEKIDEIVVHVETLLR